MKKKMRVMSQKPFNAETPNQYLRSWITANKVFFARNQGQIPEKPIPLSDWSLTIEGEVNKPLVLSFDEIYRMPKAIVSNTIECSGNSRSLFEKKATGNPWTIGGVGNAVWGGVWLRELLDRSELKANSHHVAFEGLDKPLGSAQIKFIRSIPLEKALSSSLLAYEMNGEALPLKHGYPLRALALGWTGANCVKWLHKITVLDRPFEGFYMDKVYRKFQKGQDPKTSEVVTGINLKSIITQPEQSEKLGAGLVTVLGAAYAGEAKVERVVISVDNGKTWHAATFIGPDEPYAWRQWQFLWSVKEKGEYTLMSRATDTQGNQQPMNADWNVLGYGNNGVREHAVTVQITF
ncbi:MAG: sulfite oxidase [Desulfobacteraceae bacterium]|nr:sulfite oxidase [Desulfobacteraceae bacterium]MDH3574984.1 sulfite oxidase [Desulfobacteraceae bacterium]MDH3719916.1 sulfite oxidase [Desulfobacteraceae bacterium]MDH3837946.1 sulfite oxidase [Desulfobacteraceae bacterium]MDH3874094.1 sulfite oxidase [Desulfobacteraceae bacterium]